MKFTNLDVLLCIVLLNFHTGSFPSIFTRTDSQFSKEKKICATHVLDTMKAMLLGKYLTNARKERMKGFKLKDLDKAAADGKTTFVITADTEALLLAPYNRANVVFLSF